MGGCVNVCSIDETSVLGTPVLITGEFFFLAKIRERGGWRRRVLTRCAGPGANPQVPVEPRPSNPAVPPTQPRPSNPAIPPQQPRPSNPAIPPQQPRPSNPVPPQQPRPSNPSVPQQPRPSNPVPPQQPAGGGGGCTSKKYEQCAGKNWNGCKSCAGGTTCKFQNDYYSQCL